jgi:Tol biopolymer transport system component
MIMNGRAIISTAFAVLLISASAAIGQQTPEGLLQSGIYAEEVQGDLEGAIAIYRSILTDYPESRAVGARAQLHIGLCLEVLGLGEAGQAYQRVVDDYSEHRDEVALAMERLASLRQELAELRRGPTFRRIEIATRPQNGVLSPDGSSLAFVSDGSVWVVPMQGNAAPDVAGEPLRIATVPGVWDYYSQMAWSADGQWIAVNGGGATENVAHVFPAGGGEPRTIQLPPRRGHYKSNRLSLSPDGQKLVFSAFEPGRELEGERLYSIHTEGGQPQQMASIPSRMPAFSPDGELVAFVGYPENGPEGGGGADDLWVVPSSGGTPIKLTNVDRRLRGPLWSPDGMYIAAHHEPLAGNPSDEIWVYPLSPDMSSAGEPMKIVLPRETYHILSGWTPDNELGVFIESETREAIYTVTLSGGKAVQVSQRGGYYPRWSPDGERIYVRTFFGERDTGRVTDLSAGYESTAYIPVSGGPIKEVTNLSHRELGIVIPGGGLSVSPDGKRFVISAAETPWGPQEGVDLWTVPVDSGSPTRLTMDASGEAYPCWSPDGRWIAFTDDSGPTSGQGDSRAIFMVPAEGGEIRQVTSALDSVGGGAIAFSPDGERIAFFSGDAIKTIPVQGGRPAVVVTGIPSERHSQLAWSPDGSRIAHDDAEGKIWITPLDGGAPEELRTGLPEDARIGDFSWSPDGEKIAFVGSIGGYAEFWLISDFLPEKR